MYVYVYVYVDGYMYLGELLSGSFWWIMTKADSGLTYGVPGRGLRVVDRRRVHIEGPIFGRPHHLATIKNVVLVVVLVREVLVLVVGMM